MPRRIITTLAIAAASLSLTAGTALAKHGGRDGGGGGGSTPAPAPAPAPAPSFDPWTLCSTYPQLTGTLADGSSWFANVISDGACLIVKSSPSGALTLYKLDLAPGWTAEVDSAGGSDSNRVDVDIYSPEGEKHSATISPGKTRIK